MFFTRHITLFINNSHDHIFCCESKKKSVYILHIPVLNTTIKYDHDESRGKHCVWNGSASITNHMICGKGT